MNDPLTLEERRMLSEKGSALFYEPRKPFGWLSNFERSPITIHDRIYPTVEHYYQAQKTTDPDISNWIASAPNPTMAMIAGRGIPAKYQDLLWDKIKFAIMRRGLLAKFSQHQYLRERLIATGDFQIHENSPTDLVWGIRGADELGKMLMAVRQMINTGLI